WLPEHLVFPVEMKGSPHAGDEHPPIPSDTPAFDALMSLAAIAAVTTDVRLGANGYHIRLRHPVLTGRAIATRDVVSHGRGACGGAGCGRSGRSPASTSTPAGAGSTRPSTSAVASGPTTWWSTTVSSSTSIR